MNWEKEAANQSEEGSLATQSASVTDRLLMPNRSIIHAFLVGPVEEARSHGVDVFCCCLLLVEGDHDVDHECQSGYCHDSE